MFFWSRVLIPCGFFVFLVSVSSVAFGFCGFLWLLCFVVLWLLYHLASVAFGFGSLWLRWRVFNTPERANYRTKSVHLCVDTHVQTEGAT